MTDPTRISDDQHNNAPAVPQGWTKAADQVPLEADGEVFIRFTDGSIGTGWATYWHGASNEFAQWTFPDPDEDRLVSEWAKNVPASPGMHWTENEPVRLPHARAGRVYLAGPMTGISELNFPSFNQEAERLRADGLQVLNPADHGIVDGADWTDYLRHDIAGLASCERIHLLRGWTKSKGACLEMTIAKALRMTVTYQVDAEMEHNNAPAVPQGEPVAYIETITGRLCAPLDEHRLKFPMCYEPLCKQGTAPAQEPMQSFTVPDDLPGMWEHSDLTGGETDCAKPAQEVGLTDEQKTWAVNQLMEQAQVFASAWSLVGGRHDFGNALEEAEQAKTELRSMVVAALRAKGGK